MLALESTIAGGGRTSWLSGVHPAAFRRACVAGASRSAKGKGSIVEALARLLGDESADPETRALTLQAIEAIAIDDPSTDVDNDHTLALCAAGVVPHVVRLLASPAELVHSRAAAAAAALVENKHCAKMFVGSGAINPLVALTKHGDDETRVQALAALRMLAIDRDARERIGQSGGAVILRGLAKYGPVELRAAALEFVSTLDSKQTVSVDASAHARQARATRVGQSKLRSSRLRKPPPEEN